MPTIGRAVIDFVANTVQFDKKLTKIQRSVRGLERGFNRLSNVAGGFLGAVAVRNVTRAGLAIEGFESSLRFATGSAEGAAKAMGFVREEADRLGLDLQSSIQGFTGIAAAARGTSLEGERTREIFTGVAEASRVMNLSVQDTTGVMRAIEQIISKGTVQAEELRGQLGERLPGAFQLAAKAAGVTVEELGDMLKNGEVLAEDLLPKLAVELRKAVGPEVGRASQNSAAAFNRFQTAIFDLQIEIAQGGLLDSLTTIANFFTENIPKATQFAKSLGEMAAGASGFGVEADILGRQLEEARAEVDRLTESFTEFGSRKTLDALNAARQKVNELTQAQLEAIDATGGGGTITGPEITAPTGGRAASEALEKISISVKRIERTPLDELALATANAKEQFIALQRDGIEGLEAARTLQEARDLLLEMPNAASGTLDELVALVDAQKNYEDQVAKTVDGLQKQKEKSEEIAKVFGEQQLRNSQDALAGFIVSASQGFKGLDDVAKRFLGTLIEIIAQAAAAKFLTAFVGGGGGGGFLASLLGFQFGGGFKGSSVGGGTDSQVVAFRKSPTESVSVDRPGQSRGGGVTLNQTNNIDARGAGPEVLPRIAGLLQANKEQTKAEIVALFRQGAIPL